MIHWIGSHPDVLGVKLLPFKLGVQPTMETRPNGKGTAPGETNAFSVRKNKYEKRVVKFFGPPPGNAVKQGKISGDASVMTITSKEVLRRIAKMCGLGVRFVVMLRDPVERAISLATMRCVACAVADGAQPHLSTCCCHPITTLSPPYYQHHFHFHCHGHDLGVIMDTIISPSVYMFLPCRYGRRGEKYAKKHPDLNKQIENELMQRRLKPYKWTGEFGADYVTNAEYGMQSTHKSTHSP